MEKVILKDGTSIEVTSMPSIGSITTICHDVAAVQALKDKMTSDNISEISVENEVGLKVGNYTDYVPIDTWTIQWTDDGIKTTFGFRKKSETELIREELSETKKLVDSHDSAIIDLGEAVGGMQ